VLRAASTLKPEVLEGVDMVFVRELTGGIYFGDKQRTATSASDLCLYTVAEIERIVRVAARLASARSGRLHSIDKANVLETSRLWREVCERVVKTEFPKLTLEHMLVDSAAMHLIRRPRDFDVAVTENMFGDILTDEASMLAGSLGLLPSASLGDARRGLYEPIHGSAPDIAGRGIANPFGAILSVALLLRHSLELESEAVAIESAVERVISGGLRTADLVAPGVGLATSDPGASSDREPAFSSISGTSVSAALVGGAATKVEPEPDPYGAVAARFAAIGLDAPIEELRGEAARAADFDL